MTTAYKISEIVRIALQESLEIYNREITDQEEKASKGYIDSGLGYLEKALDNLLEADDKITRSKNDH